MEKNSYSQYLALKSKSIQKIDYTDLISSKTPMSSVKLLDSNVNL